jgi:hypothetical protein
LKILSKEEWGSGSGITIINKKDVAAIVANSEIDETKVLNAILEASNYDKLVHEAYAYVPDNWQEDPEQLAGLHHVVHDGMLIVHEGRCKATLTLSQGKKEYNIEHIEKHCKTLGVNIAQFNNAKHLLEGEGLNQNKLKFRQSVAFQTAIDKVKLTEAVGSLKEGVASMKLVPTIKAIHSGKTGNNHLFVSEFLRGDPNKKPNPTGIYSFTTPYPKPMLLNHDSYWGEPLGRITDAIFVVDQQGMGVVLIKPEITDPDAIQKILDKRYLTVSVGCTCDSVRCNICGTDLMETGWCEHYRFDKYDTVIARRINGVCNICGTEGPCPHIKGEEYSDVECFWILGPIWFDECSFVNVPADQNAGVIDAGVPVMETYLEFNNELYNINNDDISLNQSSATCFGLTIKNTNKGGSSEVVDVPNLQEQVVETVDQAPIVEAQPVEPILEDKVTELTATISDLTTQNEALTRQVGDSSQNIETLRSEKETLTLEKDTLSKENIELALKAQKMLAARVADFKIVFGEITKENREIEESELSGQSEESLLNLLSEYLGKLTKYDFSKYRIDPPPIGDVTTKETIDLSREIANLMTGKYAKNTQRSEK